MTPLLNYEFMFKRDSRRPSSFILFRIKTPSILKKCYLEIPWTFIYPMTPFAAVPNIVRPDLYGILP
jgi:hypothetical protein